MELINRPNDGEKSASFSFEIERQSGNEVLNLENVSIGYDENKYVVQDANLRIKKGESLALVGPNGVGNLRY